MHKINRLSVRHWRDEFDMNANILWTVGMSLMVVIFLIASNNIIYGQVTEDSTSQSATDEWIKIVTPETDQQIPAGKEFTVSGESSDDTSKDCDVSVIVNYVKPYHTVSATGAGGADDYSQWDFTLSSNYTEIKEGTNKITAKLFCSPTSVRWYSVDIMGVYASQANTNISLPTLAPSVLTPTNESEAANLSRP
jgi:FlaG/FlaF family flagellin (archaellin)